MTGSVSTFSPTLGLLTAGIELLMAGWVLRQVRSSTQRSLILILLALLAGYQLLEVVICMSPDPSSPVLTRLAFLDITWLPPLGLLLMMKVGPEAPTWMKRFVSACLGLGVIMSVWILLDYRFITGTMCEFVYAKYSYVEPYFHIYGAFYEISQMSLVFLPAVLMPNATVRAERENLRDLQIGTLLFILPSIYLVAVVPGITGQGLPSIMCHFAFFLAVFLTRIAGRLRGRTEPTS